MKNATNRIFIANVTREVHIFTIYNNFRCIVIRKQRFGIFFKQRNAISLVSTVCSLWSALMWCEKHCEQVTPFCLLELVFYSFISLSHHHNTKTTSVVLSQCATDFNASYSLLLYFILYFFLFWFEPSSPKIKNNYLASGKRQKSCNRITKTNY